MNEPCFRICLGRAEDVGGKLSQRFMLDWVSLSWYNNVDLRNFEILRSK